MQPAEAIARHYVLHKYSRPMLPGTQVHVFNNPRHSKQKLHGLIVVTEEVTMHTRICTYKHAHIMHRHAHTMRTCALRTCANHALGAEQEDRLDKHQACLCAATCKETILPKYNHTERTAHIA